jgi:hypothetical protein
MYANRPCEGCSRGVWCGVVIRPPRLSSATWRWVKDRVRTGVCLYAAPGHFARTNLA